MKTDEEERRFDQIENRLSVLETKIDQTMAIGVIVAPLVYIVIQLTLFTT
jgi:hypothetical protein